MDRYVTPTFEANREDEGADYYLEPGHTGSGYYLCRKAMNKFFPGLPDRFQLEIRRSRPNTAGWRSFHLTFDNTSNFSTEGWLYGAGEKPEPQWYVADGLRRHLHECGFKPMVGETLWVRPIPVEAV